MRFSRAFFPRLGVAARAGGGLVVLACALLLWLGMLGCENRQPPPPRPFQGYGPPIAPSPLLTTPPAPLPTAQPIPLPTVQPSAVPPAEPALKPTKLVVKARPALSVSTLQDDAVIVLNLEAEDGYLTEKHAAGVEELALTQLKFTIGISGAQTMELVTVPQDGRKVALRHEGGMALRISKSDLAFIPWIEQRHTSRSGTLAWKTAPTEAPFSKPGKYDITLSVEVPLSSGTQVVKAPQLQLERRVRGRSTTTLTGVEKIAKQAAEIHLNKLGRTKDKDKLQPTLMSVDLDNGNRLVRFWIPQKKAWTITFLEVEVERNGNVVKVREQERFTCVAEHTRIETDHGLVPIEELRPGDRVWSWDEHGKKRVLSEVEALSPPRMAATMLIAGKLRVTGSHPLWANGDWVQAAELAVGDTLLSHGGSPLALASIQADGELARVFDLAVSSPHNYFAEGILVHNKRMVMPPQRLDPLFVLWERASGKFDLLAPKGG